MNHGCLQSTRQERPLCGLLMDLQSSSKSASQGSRGAWGEKRSRRTSHMSKRDAKTPMPISTKAKIVFDDI